MTALGLALLTAVAIAGGAPSWLCLLLALPTVLLAPGIGWARWALRTQQRLAERGFDPMRVTGRPPVTSLQLLIDAAWISLAFTWVAVAGLREVGAAALGLDTTGQAWALLAACALFGAVGSLLGRNARPAPSLAPELPGGLAVLLALLLSAAWKQSDLARPLDAYWWLAEAQEEEHPTLPLRLEGGEPFGWEESPAWKVTPQDGRARIVADGPSEGRVFLVQRGPVGSRLALANQTAEVQRDVMEAGEEAPVRRYLDDGAVALAVPIDLQAGQSLEVRSEGEALYLLPGSTAIWSLHSTGELRFTHYWQILNQVENLDWAREVLEWRRLTLNQPPGWSPILSLAVLFGQGDMPDAGLVFFYVLALIGASAVRLGALLAPEAPPVAWVMPAALVPVLALLMIEPGSTMFPDPLFTAALLGAAASLVGKRMSWFALLGVGASLIRYPGVFVATLLALAGAASGSTRAPWRGLAMQWALAVSALLVALALMFAGHAEDLLFILYFETFPEHWHDDYSPTSLLPRIPEFYLLWLRYSGGGLLLALLAALGPTDKARRGVRFLLGGAFAYSLVLCTIDHHPSHYFLPLVSFSAVAVWVGSAATLPTALRWALPLLSLLGMWITLGIGQVF